MSPDRRRAGLKRWLPDLLIPVAVVVAIDVLTNGRIGIVAFVAILLLTVAWVAYRGGVAAGAFAAVITGAYAAHALITREVVPGAPADAPRIAGLLVALLLMALLVGRLHRRLEAVRQEEGASRRGAEQRIADLSQTMARAQEAIRFQAGLLDAVNQAVLATDEKGHVVYVNRAAGQLLGCTLESASGRSLHEIVPEAVAAADAAEHENGWSREIEVHRPDGSTLTVLISDSPIRDDTGRITGTVCVATDLSFRRRAEESQKLLADAGAVLAASLDYESTIRSLCHLAVPALADCCIVDITEEDNRMRRLEATHVSPEKEALARDVRRRHPLTVETKHPISEVIRSGRPRLIPVVEDALLRSFAYDQEHIRVLRRLDYHSAMIVPLLASGRILGALSFFTSESGRQYDTRDLALAEEIARRAATAIEHARLYESALVASQSKSDFLAVMSHELRTPLTTVMGYADLLLSGLADPLAERAELYVQRVRSAAWHLLGLIEQILIYARLEVGREQVHSERFSITDLLRDAAALIEPVAAERGIGFHIEAPDPPLAIETDMTKLRQILLNLLGNAVKFTDSGEVILSGRSTDRGVEITVRDTGIGIEPEYLEKVFDPFWQVDQSSTRSVGGTGLGLSVSRRLARLLGGEVSVVSSPGEGTTFAVRLPLRFVPPPDGAAPESSIIRPIGRSTG